MRVRLKPVEDQVVVLMGASSGIGRETALRLAERGAGLVLSARSEEDLESVAEEVRKRGGRATVIPADATDPGQVRAVAERAVAEYGRIDTWVQLAGVGLWARLEETTADEWRRVIDVNLNGQAFGAMAAIPHLRRQGGALIHVSSVEAHFAIPYQTAYTASKHGIHGLVKALRLELAKEGAPISVTEIMPAGTNTPIFDASRTKIGVKPMPIPPIYEPSVVADAIIYAAEHPIKELVTGGVSAAGMILQRLSPALMDAFLLWQGFRAQKTDQPKTADAPTNLFQPGVGSRSEDGLGPARSFSLYTWLQTHPPARAALGLGVLAAAAIIASRARRGEE